MMTISNSATAANETVYACVGNNAVGFAANTNNEVTEFQTFKFILKIGITGNSNYIIAKDFGLQKPEDSLCNANGDINQVFCMRTWSPTAISINPSTGHFKATTFSTQSDKTDSFIMEGICEKF